eukprot:GHVU01189471.1.p3 GENE.GHVU01189471.1~~GHVU01189471.1.p3  ORF type:complete len:121 (+),score=19.97 GHVU01189471.1:1424-1786(+)
MRTRSAAVSASDYRHYYCHCRSCKSVALLVFYAAVVLVAAVTTTPGRCAQLPFEIPLRESGAWQVSVPLQVRRPPSSSSEHGEWDTKYLALDTTVEGVHFFEKGQQACKVAHGGVEDRDK